MSWDKNRKKKNNCWLGNQSKIKIGWISHLLLRSERIQINFRGERSIRIVETISRDLTYYLRWPVLDFSRLIYPHLILPPIIFQLLYILIVCMFFFQNRGLCHKYTYNKNYSFCSSIFKQGIIANISQVSDTFRTIPELIPMQIYKFFSWNHDNQLWKSF